MMKALIADDEYHVIQAIRLLVPWEELGISKVLTASCGQEAIALIEAENPELVITDIVMEDKSGLEIMDFVAGYSPASKVIAVSGHNDFEYVRAMLTKGCLDYLLKPLETDTLVATVKKAVEAYEEERRLAQGRQRLQEKVLSLSAFYSGVLLYKMLNPKTADGAYTELLEEAPGFSAVTSCRLFYYHTRYFPMDDPDFSQRMKRWDTGLSQRFSSKGLILANPDNGEEVLLFIPDLADSVAAGVIKGAQALFAGQPAFHIGASGWLPFPEEFSQAYEQAREAFMSRYGDIPSGGSIMTPPPVSPAKGSPRNEQSLFSVPSEDLQAAETGLLSALIAGDKNSLSECSAKWLDLLLPPREIPLGRIHFALERVRDCVERWLAELQKKSPGFVYDPSEAVLDYRRLTDSRFLFSREKAADRIAGILSGLCAASSKSRSGADVMAQIARYMELNYKEPFIQADYARIFYLNKDYMSRKFTSTFHVNMLTYLHRIRIRHAKELLADSSLKVQEIAYAVGFKDEKYFAKQFKKITGLTPGDYRASLEREG